MKDVNNNLRLLFKLTYSSMIMITSRGL